MEQKSDKIPKRPQSREDRLKAALKANMGKRKAQARARQGTESDNNNIDQKA